MAENIEGIVTNKGKLTDKNKLFFGLIHYILSEQNNVNWLIRSSLIDITGVSNVLEEKPYKKDSILQDVVDYITEMKPYHVQFSHYFEHYQTASETIRIPGNDWLEPTYNLRFDALQSYPSINKIFHSVVSTLPTEEDASEKKYNLDIYNTEGLVVFNTSDNHFYVRHFDEITDWTWIESDEKLSYDGYYGTIYNNKELYKVVYDTEKNSDTLQIFNKNDLKEFLNSHRANRLFYIKYWDKENHIWNSGGINDFEEIKKELNANFKGIEINGSVFDIEKFGYDIFNYDTTDYDSPTVIYDYYFIDNKENIFEEQVDNPLFIFENGFTYKKVFVSSKEHRFSLDPEFANNMVTGYYAMIYKCSASGEITDYFDYELLPPYDFIDIFHTLHDKEKTYIVIAKQEDSSEEEKLTIKYAYVLEGTSFIESSSDVLKREMVVYNPNGNELRIPSAEIASEEKIAVQKKTQSGSYNPFTNYVFNNGKITIISGINVYDHIIMTAFDYKYLYDKIYTWEDRYGRSNNIVNLDGMGFLRARYEDDRPSEKVVSYPLNTLFIKRKENETSPNYTIFMNDFKNNQTSTMMYNNAGAILCKDPAIDENGMITSLYINNINNFEIPIGKALINSEILEYKTVMEHEDSETGEKYWELTNFNRGMYGSTLFSELLPKYPPYKMTHALGDKIVPYIEDEWYSKERNNVYKSYNVLGNDIKNYTCPTGYRLDSSVEVTKLPKVNLVENVTGNSSDIVIDSPNVVSGWFNKDGSGQPISLQDTLRNESSSTVYTSQNGIFSLKIDDDEVFFKSIYKDPLSSNYHVTDITLPSKYQNYGDNVIYEAGKAFIASCIPEVLDNYNISYIEGDFTYDIINVNKKEKFIYIPIENSFKGESGVSCTDDYVYFEVNEKDIVNGNIKRTKFYPVYESTLTNKVTISNEITQYTPVNFEVCILNNGNVIMSYQYGSHNMFMNTEISESIERKEKEITTEVLDTFVQMPNGVNLYRIDNNGIYLINTTFVNEDTIETTENYFGYISNNYVYKTNGDIFAKIEDNKFISIQTIITVNDELKKGESLHINIIN